MGTAVKHPVPDRVKPSFVIIDIRALWLLGLSVRVPRCQKLQTMAWPGLAQDALWLYPYGNNGRQRVNSRITRFLLNSFPKAGPCTAVVWLESGTRSLFITHLSPPLTEASAESCTIPGSFYSEAMNLQRSVVVVWFYEERRQSEDDEDQTADKMYCNTCHTADILYRLHTYLVTYRRCLFTKQYVIYVEIGHFLCSVISKVR